MRFSACGPGRRGTSPREFVNPLVAAPYNGSYIICGSAGGAPADPQFPVAVITAR